MGSARVVGFLSTWINHTTLESVSVDESQSGKVETLDGFFFFFNFPQPGRNIVSKTSS